MPALTADDYIQRIKTHFPALRWKTARLVTHGGDHDVLILDERLVFRFPKREDYLARFRAEVRLLHEVHGALPLSVPNYQFVPPTIDFGGYPLVAGVELRPHHIASMTPEARKRIATQMGEFIVALHRLPIAIATAAGFSDDYWWSQAITAIRYEQIETALRPHLSAAEIEWLDQQFDWYLSRRIPEARVILHSDLAPDHLLFDPSHDALTGIIDFADVEIGDPAIDFAGLWDYGQEFVEEALDAYGVVDSEFRQRSRFLGRVVGAEIMFENLEGKVLPESFADGRRRLQQAMADQAREP